MTTVWRVRLRSGKRGVDANASRRFALENGLVGAGWGLDDGPYAQALEDQSTDFDRYLHYARLTFPGDISLERATSRYARQMQIGDICWTYEPVAQAYWAGKVTSEAYYRQGGAFDQMDLHLLRDCRWEEAGGSDSVPDVVTRALHGPFGTITRMMRGAEEAAKAAQALL